MCTRGDGTPGGVLTGFWAFAGWANAAINAARASVEDRRLRNAGPIDSNRAPLSSDNSGNGCAENDTIFSLLAGPLSEAGDTHE